MNRFEHDTPGSWGFPPRSAAWALFHRGMVTWRQVGGLPGEQISLPVRFGHPGTCLRSSSCPALCAWQCGLSLLMEPLGILVLACASGLWDRPYGGPGSGSWAGPSRVWFRFWQPSGVICLGPQSLTTGFADPWPLPGAVVSWAGWLLGILSKRLDLSRRGKRSSASSDRATITTDHRPVAAGGDLARHESRSRSQGVGGPEVLELREVSTPRAAEEARLALARASLRREPSRPVADQRALPGARGGSRGHSRSGVRRARSTRVGRT